MKTRIPYHLLYCPVLLTAGVLSVSAVPINQTPQCTIAFLGDLSSQGADNCIALYSQSSLSQVLSTVAGEQYTVSFDVVAWQQGGGPHNTVQFSPSFGSQTLGSITFTGVGGNHNSMVLEQFTDTITATTDLTTLTLLNSSVHPDQARWAIYDVVVTPVTVTTTPPPLTGTPVPDTADSSVLAIAGLSIAGFGFVQKRSKRPV